MKIYTRTGDRGDTGLGDGSRVGKDTLRVECYGEVDELNACLGVVRAQHEDAGLDTLLAEVQRDLFAIGAQLDAGGVAAVTQCAIARYRNGTARPPKLESCGRG